MAEKLRVEVQPLLNRAIERFCDLRLEYAAQRMKRSTGGHGDDDLEATLRDALRVAVTYGMEHLPAFKMVQKLRSESYLAALPYKAKEAILRGKEASDPKLILAAWKVAQEHRVDDP